MKLYKESNFQNVDPVIFTAYRRASPFAWDDNITLISDIKFNKIFQLSRKYNIVNGYAFVLHDHLNNLALLSIIIDHKRSECEKYLKAERNSLQMLLIEINEQMHNLSEAVLSGGEKNVMNLHKTFSQLVKMR